MKDLLYENWNAEGILPGPEESAEAYEKRALVCLHEREKLLDHLQQELPFLPEESVKQQYYPTPLASLQAIYDLSPSWPPLLFSNRGLAPWHGGCAWIYTLNEGDPSTAFLQLRASFAKKSSLFSLYSRDEVIAHEMVHIARMAYEEPGFEEIFAYSTSPSRWRRRWGPLLQSPREGHLFLGALALPLLFLTLGILFSFDRWMSWGGVLSFLPLSLFLLATIRLSWYHRCLQRCLDSLCQIVPENRVRAIALRLTDQEIKRFGRFSSEEIREYAAKQAEKEIRWKILQKYFY